jgi:hypothetical protein
MFCKVYDRIKTEEKALTLASCPEWVERKRSEYGDLTQVKKFSSVEFHHAEEGKVLDVAPMYYPPTAHSRHDAMYQQLIAEIHDTLKGKKGGDHD